MANILAVDDEPETLELIERAFRSSEHKVTVALGGRAALQALDTNFDLAIVDYRMPPPNGLEVLLALREAQPRCLRTLMSGALELPVVLGAVNRGEVVRLFEKPFQPEHLSSVINDALLSRSRVEEVDRKAHADVLAEHTRTVRECLDGEVLQLALQPIVRSADETPVAYEALLRSSHKTLKGPLDVFTAAEHTGLVTDVTRVIATRAADRLTRLPGDALLFMNLHPSEFGEPDQLCDTLAPLHRHANRVVIEITERRSVMEFEKWRASVALLAGLGYALAVDDLGAGYSSLSVLAELAPKYVKVDMSIVRGIDADPRKRRLLELLCRFAEATSAKLIAEGVETRAEADVLRGTGVQMLQGYLYGQPSLKV